MSDPTDNWDESDWEAAMQECGQIKHVGCMMAGTEFCDFECPFRDKDLFADAKGASDEA